WQVKNPGNFRDLRSESITPSTPPKGYRNGPEYFVERVSRDEEIEKPLNVKFNMHVQETLEAGLRSVERGTVVNLPL
ncbi:MAG: hypothetical protein QW059_01415, partial [Nitrososphaerota archaeon]